MPNEEKPDKRPKCDFKVTQKDGSRQPCGSEEKIYDVVGRGPWGNQKKTPVCGKHLEEAWKKWNVDSAQPIDLGTKT